MSIYKCKATPCWNWTIIESPSGKEVARIFQPDNAAQRIANELNSLLAKNKSLQGQVDRLRGNLGLNP